MKAIGIVALAVLTGCVQGPLAEKEWRTFPDDRLQRYYLDLAVAIEDSKAYAYSDNPLLSGQGRVYLQAEMQRRNEVYLELKKRGIEVPQP